MRTIQLTRSQITIVDDADYDQLVVHEWKAYRDHRTGKYYAGRRSQGRVITLASAVLGTPPAGLEIDHKNGDGLLNTRSNLRFATRTEQQRNRRKQKNNTSGFKGVDWFKKLHKWRAKIKVNRVQRLIGYYDSKEAAAKAYDNQALELFGDFAVLNFPKG